MSAPPQKIPGQQVATPKSVTIIESKEFERDADALFSKNERRAVYLVLSDNPLAGETLLGRALFRLEIGSYVVEYAVSPSLEEVFLLTVEKGNDKPPPPDEGEWMKKVKASVSLLVKGGILGAGKKLADWLISNL